MITPNHATHYDSNSLYLAADKIGTPLYYMTAWQVFGMSSLWERHLMQWMGCFSIDRESADRQAFRQAVGILRHEPFPLVVFPEGDIYHMTDRVTPFREGAATVALASARRASRSIVVVPCGIKFRYIDDPMPGLEKLMAELEQRLFLRTEPSRPLSQRIYRFAEALLVLKEIEHTGGTRSGALTERIRVLAESILSELEARYGCATVRRPIPDRVKDLRQRIIQRLGPYKKRKQVVSPEFVDLSRDMDDLFLVMQLYSYPGDYLVDAPSVERIAETLDKFEEDVLDRPIPSVKGRRVVDVAFGPSIAVPSGGSRRASAGELTIRMQMAVQRLIDSLCDAPVENARREREPAVLA